MFLNTSSRLFPYASFGAFQIALGVAANNQAQNQKSRSQFDAFKLQQRSTKGEIVGTQKLANLRRETMYRPLKLQKEIQYRV